MASFFGYWSWVKLQILLPNWIQVIYKGVMLLSSSFIYIPLGFGIIWTHDNPYDPINMEFEDVTCTWMTRRASNSFKTGFPVFESILWRLKNGHPRCRQAPCPRKTWRKSVSCATPTPWVRRFETPTPVTTMKSTDIAAKYFCFNGRGQTLRFFGSQMVHQFAVHKLWPLPSFSGTRWTWDEISGLEVNSFRALAIPICSFVFRCLSSTIFISFSWVAHQMMVTSWMGIPRSKHG